MRSGDDVFDYFAMDIEEVFLLLGEGPFGVGRRHEFLGIMGWIQDGYGGNFPFLRGLEGR